MHPVMRAFVYKAFIGFVDVAPFSGTRPADVSPFSGTRPDAPFSGTRPADVAPFASTGIAGALPFTGTRPAEVSAGKGKTASGNPSRPSSSIDRSSIRKNRHTPFGE